MPHTKIGNVVANMGNVFRCGAGTENAQSRGEDQDSQEEGPLMNLDNTLLTNALIADRMWDAQQRRLIASVESTSPRNQPRRRFLVWRREALRAVDLRNA